MKKSLSLGLCFLLMLSMLVGCTNKADNEKMETTSTNTQDKIIENEIVTNKSYTLNEILFEIAPEHTILKSESNKSDGTERIEFMFDEGNVWGVMMSGMPVGDDLDAYLYGMKKGLKVNSTVMENDFTVDGAKAKIGQYIVMNEKSLPAGLDIIIVSGQEKSYTLAFFNNHSSKNDVDYNEIYLDIVKSIKFK